MVSNPPHPRRQCMCMLRLEPPGCLGLQARDLAALACVSRDMRCVACSDTVWEPLFVAEFGAPSPADGLRPGTGAFMAAFGARWAECEHRRRQRRYTCLLVCNVIPPGNLAQEGSSHL